MAIIIQSNHPHWIVEQIRKRIDNSTIDTWSYDDDGDFTHTGQWENHAWMSPIIQDEKLIFRIWGRKSVKTTLMEYSIFHGRFLEMLLNQFPNEIKEYSITAPNIYPQENQSIEL